MVNASLLEACFWAMKINAVMMMAMILMAAAKPSSPLTSPMNSL